MQKSEEGERGVGRFLFVHADMRSEILMVGAIKWGETAALEIIVSFGLGQE